MADTENKGPEGIGAVVERGIAQDAAAWSETILNAAGAAALLIASNGPNPPTPPSATPAED